MRKYFVSFRVSVSSMAFYNGALDCFMQDCTAHFGYDFSVKIKRTDLDTFSIITEFSDNDFSVSPTRENILYTIRKGREYFGGEFSVEYQVKRINRWFLADCVFENGRCTDRYFDVIHYND